MEKGEYRKKAAELGMVIICPDTSPRGDEVVDEKPEETTTQPWQTKKDKIIVKSIEEQ